MLRMVLKEGLVGLDEEDAADEAAAEEKNEAEEEEEAEEDSYEEVRGPCLCLTSRRWRAGGVEVSSRRRADTTFSSTRRRYRRT